MKQKNYKAEDEKENGGQAGEQHYAHCRLLASDVIGATFTREAAKVEMDFIVTHRKPHANALGVLLTLNTHPITKNRISFHLML